MLPTLQPRRPRAAAPAAGASLVANLRGVVVRGGAARRGAEPPPTAENKEDEESPSEDDNDEGDGNSSQASDESASQSDSDAPSAPPARQAAQVGQPKRRRAGEIAAVRRRLRALGSRDGTSGPFCLLFIIFVIVQLVSLFVGHTILREEPDEDAAAALSEPPRFFAPADFVPGRSVFDEAAAAAAAHGGGGGFSSGSSVGVGAGAAGEGALVLAERFRPWSDQLQLGPLPPAAPAVGVAPGARDAVVDWLRARLAEALSEVARLVEARRALPVFAEGPAVPRGDTSRVLRAACRSERHLRVLALNLWGVRPPWDRRRQSLVNLLRALAPDVIGLFDVRFDVDGENQAAQLAASLRELGFHYVYARVRPEVEGGEEGVALLSRYPIVNASSLGLRLDGAGSTSAEPFPPVAIHAVLATPAAGRVNVFVTRFPESRREQCAAAASLARELHAPRVDRTLPTLVLADTRAALDYEWPTSFLAEPRTPLDDSSYNPCRGLFAAHPWPPALPRLRDAWAVVHPTLPGHTFPVFRDARVAVAQRSTRVWARGGSRGAELLECDAGLAGEESAFADEAGRIAFPSAHRAVVAAFAVDSRPDVEYARKLAELRAAESAASRPAA